MHCKYLSPKIACRPFGLFAIIAILFASISFPAQGTQTSPYIGINIQNVADYNGDLLFADAMKESRTWTDLSGNTLTNVDANGWPLQDAKIYVWAGSGTDMSGTYALSFSGQATVTVLVNSGTVSNQSYNSSTNTTTATLTLVNTDLQLQFTNTKHSSSSGTNTGIANVKLMRPTSPGATTSYSTSTVFTNQMKNLVANFNVIRFMDYLATNSNQQVNWSDRLTANYYSYNVTGTGYGWEGRGGAWEYAVLLCNQTNKDMWINIPEAATDAYVTNVANLILYGSDGTNPYTSPQSNPVFPPLNANLKVYVEFSNEVWNTAGAFQQSQMNYTQAQNEVGAGGSPLNFDGDTNTWDWAWRRVAERGVEISTDFRDVFGNNAMMTTVRPVLMSQLGYADGPLLQEMHLLEDYYNNPNYVSTPHPPSYYFYGAGGSAYYNPNNTDTTMTLDTIWTSQTFNVSNWAASLQSDSAYVLGPVGRRIAYEGGPSMDSCGCSADTIKNEAWSDNRMTTLVTGHQIFWNQYGGDLLCYFDSVGNYEWGFTHDINTLSTPKLAAISLINQSTTATGTLGTAVPGTITATTYQEPPGWVMSGFSPNSMNAANNWNWFNYVINVSTASTFSVAVSAGSASSNGLLDVYVDGALAGTISIPNTGNLNTFQTSGTITTPLLSVGTHGLQIKAHAGAFNVQSIILQVGGSPPPAPTNLAATAGNGQVGLTWSASTGATSYNIYRGTSAGGESTTPLATNITTTSYTDTSVTNGTTYFYKAAAVNSAGTSGYSNEASATPTLPIPLQINSGGGAVSPFIADTYYSGGTAATNYTGTIDTSGVTNPAPQAVYQSERYGNNTYIVPGLLPNTAYTVRLHFCENYWSAAGDRTFNVSINGTQVLSNFDIYATAGAMHKAVARQFNATANASGQIVIQYTTVINNALSNGIEILTGITIPPAPTNLAATPGNGQVALTWSASSGATGYNVYRGTTAGGESPTPIASNVTSTSYTDTGVTNWTKYYYTVAAVNSAGTSASSNEVSATPSTGNTHSGNWALKAVMTSTATWVNAFQTPSCAANSTYTASFWMKGTGAIVLRVLSGAWGTEITRQTFTASSTWQQFSFTFNTGSNTQLTYNFTNGGGIAGTIYIDDCFLGLSGGTNVLGNPGFESGNTVWTIDTSIFSIVNNP